MNQPLRPDWAYDEAFTNALSSFGRINQQEQTNQMTGAIRGIADIQGARKVGAAQLELAKANQRLGNAGSGGIGNVLGSIGGALGGLRGAFGGFGGGSSSGFSLGNSFTKDYGLGSQTGSGLSNLSSYWGG